ncbi:MAG TPA: hypothetical protein VFU36_13135 [Jatrophihabitans sp.]|nr:hypothetical protein [Jatrophihabitans sp.]
MTAAGSAEHVVVIHRWRASGGLYQDYLDHLAVDVSYIVPPAAAGSVPRTAAGVEVVDRIDDLVALANAAGRLRRQVGPPTRIVALAADDQDAAAELRVLLGCAGQRPEDRATLRDRYAMLTAVAAAGIEVQRFAVVSQGSDVLRLLAEQPAPVLLTPRFGSAEAVELLIRTPDDAERLGGVLAEPMLARAYPAATRYAVAGVWDGSRLVSWRAARRLGTEPSAPGDPAGGWRGWVELDGDPAGTASGGPAGPVAPDRLAELAGAALGALVSGPAAVYVAISARDRPGRPPELSFDRASTGMPGSELPLLWQEVHGVDLAGVALAGQLDRPLPRLAGLRPMPEADGETGRLGGWLQVFLPVPCRVTAIDFTPGEPAPYAAVLPRVGERLPAGERVAAGLRFRAARTAELERAVHAAADGLRLRCEPL